MKKLLLSFLSLFIAVSMMAQVVNDQVILGAGYTDQVYYQLSTQTKNVSASDSWDLGFVVTLMDASVISNEQTITVYNVPNADSNDYATLNTANYIDWSVTYNSDTSWYKGALNIRKDAADYFDFGWGKYDFTTHSVHGDSLFVIEKGGELYKFWIRKKTETGDYLIRYKNLTNGSNDVDLTIPAAQYATKNFVYLKLESPVVLDLEPATTDWDLFFTNYVTVIPYLGYYPVTGVLSNVGVNVAEAKGVDVATVSFGDYSSSYKTNMSEIGYDWKTYDFYANEYVIEDSLIYFIKGKNGSIYSIQFTGFDNVNGVVSFETQQLLTGIETPAENLLQAAVYPNPASDFVTIIYDSKSTSKVNVQFFDLSGKEVMANIFEAKSGLNTEKFQLPRLSSGVYQLLLTSGNDRVSKKVLIAR